MKKLFFSMIAVICICSCKQVIKKLGANPKVSYYIVGRLKTIEVNKSLPFEVKVTEMNSQLIEKPFGLKIENPEQFSLSYLMNDEEERKTYRFGEEIKNKNMDLIICKTDIVDSSYALLKNIDYQFQVKGEVQQ